MLPGVKTSTKNQINMDGVSAIMLTFSHGVNSVRVLRNIAGLNRYWNTLNMLRYLHHILVYADGAVVFTPHISIR